MSTTETNPGNFFEDFRQGQVITHATPRSLTEGDMALYTSLYVPRLAVQSSLEFARAIGYPKSSADDLLLFHVVFGKTVPDISLNATSKPDCWSRGMKSLICLFSAMVATGCCTSMTRAEEIKAELREENVVRAEPAMRRAASERGATLLPERALEFGLIPQCEGIFAADLERICVLSTDYTIHRIRGVRGAMHMAISIQGHAPSTTRLARRGDTFLFVVPSVTARKISARTQCECDRSPKIQSMSDFLDLGYAFMLEDVPTAKVVPEQISVPVVEDYIAWECKMGLL